MGPPLKHRTGGQGRQPEGQKQMNRAPGERTVNRESGWGRGGEQAWRTGKTEIEQELGERWEEAHRVGQGE